MILTRHRRVERGSEEGASVPRWEDALVHVKLISHMPNHPQSFLLIRTGIKSQWTAAMQEMQKFYGFFSFHKHIITGWLDFYYFWQLKSIAFCAVGSDLSFSCLNELEILNPVSVSNTVHWSMDDTGLPWALSGCSWIDGPPVSPPRESHVVPHTCLLGDGACEGGSGNILE